jgi:predicted DNA-binding transcriptional regulator AlpA
MQPKTKPKKYLNARELCTRYGRADRTIDRWVEAGVLPQPIYIQRQRYWDEAEIDARDAARASEVAS